MALVLTASALSTSVYAGWGDKFKEVFQDEDIQKTVKETVGGSTSEKNTSLSMETIISGLKEALEVGSRRAITQISQPGGYLDNQDIKIPLPDNIEKVASVLKKYGLESQVEKFEKSMNTAAEKAAPHATELIISAIKDMSFEDAKKIYAGDDDAATEYFKAKTSSQLKTLFQPSVEKSLGQVGATRYYNELVNKAKGLPYVGDKVKMDLNEYVTDEALNGLFKVLADEEKQIRENPVARTTDLLKQLFE